MNKQRKVVITTTYNEMGIIIDTKVEEVAQPNLHQLATDTISRAAAIEALDKCHCGGKDENGRPWIYKENAVEAIEMVEPSPQIIRCKDCGYWERWNTFEGQCMLSGDGEIREEGNDIGYKDGVNDGRNETWEAARKIAQQWEEDTDTEHRLVIDDSISVTLDSMTASEAIEKLKAYEEKQKADDEINVGDEVEVLNSGSKYLIAWIAGTSICGFSHDGVTCHLQPSDVRKTGRHFDIKGILEAMKHD